MVKKVKEIASKVWNIINGKDVDMDGDVDIDLTWQHPNPNCEDGGDDGGMGDGGTTGGGFI